MAFVEANVCATGLAGGSFDFVWGEDAWCYVEDKRQLIAEATRLLRPGGMVAFTDWMEGPAPMTSDEAKRLPDVHEVPEHPHARRNTAPCCESNGCEVCCAQDTGRFPKCVPLYLDMIEKQLTYDALRIIGFDQALASALIGEMRFLQALAEAGQIIQGVIVARKPE